MSSWACTRHARTTGWLVCPASVCSAESRVDNSAMWMDGRRRHSARVPNTASPSTCLSRRPTSRRGRPEIGSRDRSFGLLPARGRSSQAPCRACVRTCRSTRGRGGTPDTVSVEQMSSRELKCDSGSTGMCAALGVAAGIDGHVGHLSVVKSHADICLACPGVRTFVSRVRACGHLSAVSDICRFFFLTKPCITFTWTTPPAARRGGVGRGVYFVIKLRRRHHRDASCLF
jgi:hypothetical protein